MPTCKPQQIIAGLLLAIVPILVLGCGGGGTGGGSEIEQARRQGAAAAHRTDQIRQLQKEVSALRHERTARPEEEPPASNAESSAGTDARIPASGTYTGEAQQRGTPARLNKDYPVDMSFFSTGSYVDYPTLQCKGTLTPLGFEGTSRVYEETITSGHCDNGGIWLVHVVDPTSLEAAWSLGSTSYTVTAALKR